MNVLWLSFVSQDASTAAAVSKAKSDAESGHRALLLRLFPEVKVRAAEAEAKDPEQWLRAFADAAGELTRWEGRKDRTQTFVIFHL